MKFLFLFTITILIYSCGPNFEEFSFEDRALWIFYNSDDYDEKLEDLANLNPTNQQERITQLVIYSVLQSSRIDSSSTPQNTFNYYAELNNDSLLHFAKSDSLHMSNFLYILFHDISKSEFRFMPYMYDNFKDDRNFYYSGFQYLDASEVSFPFAIMGPDSTLILIENPLDSLEKQIDCRTKKSINHSDSPSEAKSIPNNK